MNRSITNTLAAKHVIRQIICRVEMHNSNTIKVTDNGSDYSRFYFVDEIIAMGGENFAAEGQVYKHSYIVADDVPADVAAVFNRIN